MISIIIVAAGYGRRMGLSYNKLREKINGKPLLLHTINTFLNFNYPIILVLNKEDIEYFKPYLDPGINIVIGGDERCCSVKNGLMSVTSKYVLIHDGARPLIALDQIIEVAEQVKNYNAAFLASLPADSIKVITEQGITSVDRAAYLLAQTPQAFNTKMLKEAYEHNENIHLDDISLFQAYYPHEKIKVLLNDRINTKVTTISDLKIVRSILEYAQFKVGHSYDIHKTKEGNAIILGGVKIETPFGIEAHSDGDCLTHSITEAIIGALGEGDLGSHFPNSDATLKNISSLVLLKKAISMLKLKCYQIENIDSTVFVESPKLAPYIEEIKLNLSKVLNINTNQINIKAATNEKLDSIGKGMGIASETVLLIRRTF